MKPRMKLIHRWHDCGWPYEWWECWTAGDNRKGAGSSPREAYVAWSKA